MVKEQLKVLSIKLMLSTLRLNVFPNLIKAIRAALVDFASRQDAAKQRWLAHVRRSALHLSGPVFSTVLHLVTGK